MTLILSPKQHAQELRDTWQGRALAHTKGHLAAVVLSVLAHSYEEALPTLLRVVFPGFRSLAKPLFTSCGKIGVSGQICATLMGKDGVEKFVPVFKSEAEMQAVFRNLADELKLTDAERIEMFGAAKAWIVADWRYGPDGNRLAS